MYRFDHVVPEVDAIVAVDRRVVRQDAAANVDRYMRGDDCSDAAASKAPLEVDPRPGSGTVIVIDTSRNAGSEQPVSYLQIAKSNRLEKDVIVHRIPLSLIFRPRYRARASQTDPCFRPISIKKYVSGKPALSGS